MRSSSLTARSSRRVCQTFPRLRSCRRGRRGTLFRLPRALLGRVARRASDHLGHQDLGVGDRDHFVECPPGETEHGSVELRGEGTGEAVQRPGPPDGIGEGEGVLVGDVEVLAGVVVAAAAGESGGVPGVEDLEAVRWCGDHACRGQPVGVGFEFVGAVEDEASADDHVGVGASAAEAPAPIDDVSTVDPSGVAGGRHPACGDHVEVGPERPSGSVVEERGEVAGVAADHDAPRDGWVGVGESLEEAELVGHAHLGAAPLVWHGDPERARRLQRCDEVQR